MLERVDLTKKLSKSAYKEVMALFAEQLSNVQIASFEAGVPLIILFEGWNAVGKGSVIRSLTKALDPFMYSLHPIGSANTIEKQYPWMWRFWSKAPQRGEWAIFDTSWYCRVMADRMEGQMIELNWRRSYRNIVDFERTLVDEGYQIVKFFLHASKQSQGRRLEKISRGRIPNRTVTAGERDQNRRYDDWLKAYEEVFDRTETVWAPWTIIEANNGRYARAKVCKTIIDTLSKCLNLSITTIDIDQAPNHWSLTKVGELEDAPYATGAAVSPEEESSKAGELKSVPNTKQSDLGIADKPQEKGQE